MSISKYFNKPKSKDEPNNELNDLSLKLNESSNKAIISHQYSLGNDNSKKEKIRTPSVLELLNHKAEVNNTEPKLKRKRQEDLHMYHNDKYKVKKVVRKSTKSILKFFKRSED